MSKRQQNNEERPCEWTDDRAIKIYNKVFAPDYCGPNDPRADAIAEEMRCVKNSSSAEEAWGWIEWWGWKSREEFMRAYKRIRRHR